MADSRSPHLLAFEKTVAAAGTAEAIHAQEFVSAIVVIAKAGNTGQVYIGGSDVDSSTNDGLDASESIAMEARRDAKLDISEIYIDVDTNGEGVDCYVVL